MKLHWKKYKFVENLYMLCDDTDFEYAFFQPINPDRPCDSCGATEDIFSAGGQESNIYICLDCLSKAIQQIKKV